MKKVKRVFRIILIGVLLIVNVLFIQSKNKVYAQGTMKVGDYVQFGQYYGQPILWKVINIDSNGSTMLWSEKILCLKSFDSAEIGNEFKEGGVYTGDLDRQRYGSNRWDNSNIREWLNSSDKIVKYTTQPPTNEAVFFGFNDYAYEAGFLNNFTEVERNAIKPIKRKSILQEIDKSEKNGGTEVFGYRDNYSDSFRMESFSSTNYDKNYYKYVFDRVYLLNVKELHDYVYSRGWEIRKKLTQSAIDNSEYKNIDFSVGLYKGLNASDYWEYWLSTPCSLDTYRNLYIDIDDVGGVGDGGRADFTLIRGGVVPALNLKSAIFKSGKGTESDPYIPSDGVVLLDDKTTTSVKSTNDPSKSGNKEIISLIVLCSILIVLNLFALVKLIKNNLKDRDRIKKEKFLYTALAILVLILILLIFMLNSDKSVLDTKIKNEVTTEKQDVKSNELSNNLNTDENSGEQKKKEQIEQNVSEMKNNINTFISSQKGEYSVAYKDAKYGNDMSANSKKTKAASVIKLFVMIDAYKQIQNGQLAEDEKIILKNNMKVAGSGNLNTQNEGKSYTIDELLELMIADSDNTAANMLIDKLGMYNINITINELGCTDTVLQRKMMDLESQKQGKENYTSVSDLSLVLGKMYNNQCVSEKYDKKMISIMKKQKNTTKIPSTLPKNVQVANKAGELVGVENDAAIVYSPEGDYILCILTDGINNNTAIKNAGIISKTVYDYNSKKMNSEI